MPMHVFMCMYMCKLYVYVYACVHVCTYKTTDICIVYTLIATAGRMPNELTMTMTAWIATVQARVQRCTTTVYDR